jgi:hypothetical protein
MVVLLVETMEICNHFHPQPSRSNEFAYRSGPWCISLLFKIAVCDMMPPMLRLTRQERTVLCVVLFLLLTGWMVKAWRTVQPPAAPDEITAPNPNAHRTF